MKTALLTFALLVSSVSFAQGDKEHKHACADVKKACEAAGFKKGEHKNKNGLHVDCMKKLMNGETVEGVSVDSAVVQQCKDNKVAHHSGK